MAARTPKVCPDLFGANLFGADLSHADLREANLRGSDLSYANLRWTDLSEADLTRSMGWLAGMNQPEDRERQQARVSRG